MTADGDFVIKGLLNFYTLSFIDTSLILTCYSYCYAVYTDSLYC